MIRSVFKGSGSALPRRVVTNEELSATVDTSDEWIRERTGITQRYLAGDGETTASLATDAARAALENAGIEASEIDLIVLATATPDQTFPATATLVQQALGCNGGAAFDVAAVCSGFLYALGTADSMIRTGMAKCALVIGAETFSCILDWEDRATCVLFGDGAGAFVIQAEEVAEDGPGVLATRLHADGAHNQLLFVDGGPSTTGTVGKLRMQGREVFRHAVTNLAEVLGEVLEAAGKTPAEVDWVVPHQANREETGPVDGQDRRHGGPPREYFGGFRPARFRRGLARRAHQAWPTRCARSDGRRLYLGGKRPAAVRNSSSVLVIRLPNPHNLLGCVRVGTGRNQP